MVTCPKCGFLQPPDQFCASCGVDMEKYLSRHQTQTSWQRLVGSSIFQAAMIFVIVMGTSLTIYRKKKAEVERQQQAQRESTTQATIHSQQTPSAQTHAAQVPQTTPPAQTPAATAPATSAQHPTQPITGARSGESEAARTEHSEAHGSGTATPESNTPMVRMYLVESTLAFLNRIGDTRVLSGQGTINAAVIPAVESHLQPGRDTDEVQVLDEGERQSVQIGKALLYSKTGVDPSSGSTIGLEAQVVPTALDVRGLHFNLTLTRSARDPQSPGGLRLTNQGYRESAVLTNNAGLFVYGLWPHRAPLPGEDRMLPEVLIRLMSRAEFVNSSSDLVFVLEGTGLPEGTPSGR